MCTNKSRDCKWQGEANYIDNHLTKDGNCEYKDVMWCSGLMQWKNITKNIETEFSRYKVNCWYCQLGEEDQFLEGKHKEECAEHPVVYPMHIKWEEAGCTCHKDMNKHRSSYYSLN